MARMLATAQQPTPMAALILAAGKGTRMKSSRTKVLHRLLGLPLVSYSVLRAQEAGAAPIVVVLGHQRTEVEKELEARHGKGALRCVEQTDQKGTGHAAIVGLSALDAEFSGLVLILCGDTPLLRTETLAALVAEARTTGGLALLSAVVPDPTGYGRIVRDTGGRVQRIVEHKDASPDERAIAEINAGVYCATAGFLRAATSRLVPQNAQGEYYLTDVVSLAVAGAGASAVTCDAAEIAGINDRRQLVEAERTLNARSIARFADHATFRDPASTVVETGVLIGLDVEIGRGVALRGRTVIGDGALIDDGVILVDTHVGPGAEIKPYCVATDARIGAGAKIGPFAHLRPGTELGPDVHIGNFVETKKTSLGRGSKANHLSYLGDAIIGAGVNIGAGTITCNYNGYEKRQTIIEDGANVGSDTQLVAPVRVGRRAVIAAGTTVTADVPEGSLAISRAEQKLVAGYADRVAERYAAKDAAKKRG